VSHPNQSRPNNRMQYFFLNRRYIRDRALQHALNEAYRGILLGGRFPLAFLQIELPADSFDVNVHPTKMEVRFLDSNRVYSGFLGAIREKFLISDLRNRVQAAGTQTTDDRRQTATEEPLPWESEEPRHTIDSSTAEKKKQEVQDWIRQIAAKSEERRQQNKDYYNDYSPLTIHHLPDRGTMEDSRWQTATDASDVVAPLPLSAVCRLPSTISESISEEPHVVQMLNRYLIVEMEEGIALIDQHALHERILYEQLKGRIQSGQLQTQRLLVPVPVDLLPNEFSCVSENIEFFKTLGLSVEPFGGNTVLISSFPAVLSKTSPVEILWSLIEPFLEWGKKLEQEELLDKLLHNMACKAAVKAGDKLSAESMQHLIRLASAEINAHHCPHGRPSTIVLSREEIDKMFER